MIAPGAMAFNSRCLPNADPYSVPRMLVTLKSFDAAQFTLTGVELMHMLRKGQLEGGVEQGQTPAEQFYSLAA